jgi:hypothetical protein
MSPIYPTYEKSSRQGTVQQGPTSGMKPVALTNDLDLLIDGKVTAFHCHFYVVNADEAPCQPLVTRSGGEREHTVRQSLGGGSAHFDGTQDQFGNLFPLPLNHLGRSRVCRSFFGSSVPPTSPRCIAVNHLAQLAPSAYM